MDTNTKVSKIRLDKLEQMVLEAILNDSQEGLEDVLRTDVAQPPLDDDYLRNCKIELEVVKSLKRKLVRD